MGFEGAALLALLSPLPVVEEIAQRVKADDSVTCSGRPPSKPFEPFDEVSNVKFGTSREPEAVVALLLKFRLVVQQIYGKNSPAFG